VGPSDLRFSKYEQVSNFSTFDGLPIERKWASQMQIYGHTGHQVTLIRLNHGGRRHSIARVSEGSRDATLHRRSQQGRMATVHSEDHRRKPTRFLRRPSAGAVTIFTRVSAADVGGQK